MLCTTTFEFSNETGTVSDGNDSLLLAMVIEYLGGMVPCPEKNGTNNILGITLTKFNKFSQILAQFMLTCLLTKKL